MLRVGRCTVLRFIIVLAFMMRALAPAAISLLLSLPATASDAAFAAKSLGYALQAAQACDHLLVLMQTEMKLERQYGRVLRGENNDLNDQFHDGALRFLAEIRDLGQSNACALAFNRLGPDGYEYPGLILNNPFD